ncbi:hypothetical protein [Halosegnis sp.]|uniref:DUF7260 family protein n=1 Tax=Halosegnis sp. TaxID=2864959 RepID=UPI0035D4AF62
MILSVPATMVGVAETGAGLVNTPWGPVTAAMLLKAVFVLTLWAAGVVAAFSYIAAARDACDEEQHRIAAELAAFERFAGRVRALTPETPSPSTTPTPAGAVEPPDRSPVTSGTDGLAAARDAYRETVMAVDHFEEDYDETLAEHARAELGPDAGGALAEGSDLTPGLQSVLAERADAAATERREFLGRLDEEARDLAETERRLSALLAESSDLVTDLERPFGTLEARWRRLDTLERHIGDVVEERTARVADDDAAVPSYLYGQFPVPDPVLADASAALGVVRERREQVTDALTRAN